MQLTMRGEFFSSVALVATATVPKAPKDGELLPRKAPSVALKRRNKTLVPFFHSKQGNNVDKTERLPLFKDKVLCKLV